MARLQWPVIAVGRRAASVLEWTYNLLSLDDWAALPEDDSRHYELVEGSLLVNPRPLPRDQLAVMKLGTQLESSLPEDMQVLHDGEVVIFDSWPPTVRVPDLAVVPTRLLRSDLPRFYPRDVRLAVEILTPGSIRTDQKVKFAEYAEAGIENYWMVNIAGSASLAAYRLVDGDYELRAEGDSAIEVADPAAITVDVRALTA